MTTRRLVYTAVFTSLVIVGGLISIPVPYTQIEVSLQTLFVIMAGILLGGRDGALAVLVYLVMGLAGLPVFTQGGGIAYVLKPSFGYLIGFPIGALVAGAIFGRAKNKTAGRAFLASLVGMIPIYAFGISYQILILHYYTGSTVAAAVAGVPAVGVMAVKDAVLCGLISMLCPALTKALGKEKRRKNVKRENIGQKLEPPTQTTGSVKQ